MATISFHPATKEQSDAILAGVSSLQRDAIPVGAVSFPYLDIAADGETVSLKWGDPEDVKIGGVSVSFWSKTVIVAKSGATPESPTDGTVLATSTVRNAHRETPLVVTLADADDYTIRAFPIAANSSVNLASENIFHDYWLFGFKINDTEVSADTAMVEYTDDNADFAPMVRVDSGSTHTIDYGGWAGNMPFAPEPWMMKNDGTLDYQLDPNDYTKKLDGTASDVGNTSYNGNAMMVWQNPVFWKCTIENKFAHYQFSNRKLDDGFECWNAKRSDGTYGMFAIGIYLASGSSTKTRSISTNGKPFTNVNAAVELTAATANGSGWYPTTLPDIQLMRLLGILVFKRTNMQDALGTRFVSGATSTASLANIGTLNNKGLFYGEGWDGSSNSTVGTKFFGFENFWGEVNNRIIGTNLNAGVYMLKLTPSGIDGSTGGFVATTNAADYAGYLRQDRIVLATNYSGQFVSKMHHGGACTMLPYAATGSSVSGYCDGMWTANTLTQLLVGGHVSSGLTAGLFSSLLNTAPSLATWAYGSRLSYHPF